MATLNISGFLSVTSADIQLRRFCVFIGPQAQGKSVVTKLIYFFERLIQRAMQEVVPGELTLEALKREELTRFEEIFPMYTWGTTAFSISYSLDDGHEIAINRKGGRKNNPATLGFSPEFQAVLKELTKTFKAKLRTALQSSSPLPLPMVQRDVLTKIIRSSEEHLSRYAIPPIFIPASRSFFANIEKNIFSLLSAKLDIDPLMAEFGSILEQARSALITGQRSRNYEPRRNTLSQASITVRNTDWANIIHGDYVFDGKDELIENGGRSVRLANSSSGQQEVIPLLLVVEHLHFGRRYSALGRGTASYFIEEPEAHLFPEAQRAVVQILVAATNRSRKNRMVITTHSPYILTAINNLSLAGKLAAEVSEDRRDKITAIVPEEALIPKSELCAFSIVDGEVKGIIDERSGLVRAFLVDEVSQVFAKEFDALLSLKQAKSRG